MIIYLGRQLLAASSDLPESRSDAGRVACSCLLAALCLTLLRAGFTKPQKSPFALVGSYSTVSPLPRSSCLLVRRSFLCGTIPSFTTGRRYRPPCPVKPGLSSAGHANSDHLTNRWCDHYTGLVTKAKAPAVFARMTTTCKGKTLTSLLMQATATD